MSLEDLAWFLRRWQRWLGGLCLFLGGIGAGWLVRGCG